MNPTTSQSLNLGNQEVALLSEVLESEYAKLLVGIRHTFHRSYRDELHRRLDLVEILIERLARLAAPEKTL
jgi:hypothetical protein